MGTIEITTETRYLDVKLTEEERKAKADRAAESAHKASQRRRAEEQLKEQAKEAKADADALEKEAAAYLGLYRTGIEGRDVPVRTEYDEVSKLVYTVRTDTGEQIEGPRPPTTEEYQRIAQVTTAQYEARPKGGKKRLEQVP